jgi:hypothetical protein
MRNHYWTIGKFADWLRGTPSLKAGTSDEWDEFHTRAKAAHPVRFWLAENGLRYLQDFVMGPIDLLYSVKYYINNRWISRTHALTAHKRDIKPGQWHDLGSRFLPCMFNELVDFVEVELAWWHLAWSPEQRQKYNMPWWAVGWWRVRTWRCPQAGLDNLDWQSNLTYNEEWISNDDPKWGKPTPQALNAQEILALYKWWKEVRPQRPDPHDVSGWSDYCEKKRVLNDGRLFGSKTTPELEKLSTKALNMSQKIEAAYEKEDTQMMCRLIKVRNALWT